MAIWGMVYGIVLPTLCGLFLEIVYFIQTFSLEVPLQVDSVPSPALT
jgi:hypothetical protein